MPKYAVAISNRKRRTIVFFSDGAGQPWKELIRDTAPRRSGTALAADLIERVAETREPVIRGG